MRDWLKDARVQKNLTMKQAADNLGISESYYSMIENGDRQKTLDLSMAQKLCDLFGMTIQQIVDCESKG